MNLLLLFLLLFSSSLPNHRLAISGEDVIVNNINNPYSQREIEAIANIKVIKLDEDITHLLTLVDDEYYTNETKPGIYLQTYQIIDQEFDGNEYYDVIYQYVLTIYNVDLNDEILNFIIKTTPTNYLNNDQIIKLIEDEFDLVVFNMEIISNDYFDNKQEGTYYMNVIITNYNNKKTKIHLQIDSYVEKPNKSFLLPILIGSGGLLLLITTILIIKRRK